MTGPVQTPGIPSTREDGSGRQFLAWLNATTRVVYLSGKAAGGPTQRLPDLRSFLGLPSGSKTEANRGSAHSLVNLPTLGGRW